MKMGLYLGMPGGGLPELGPELVTNGDFSNGGTGWTVQSDFTVTGGKAVGVSSGVLSRVYQNVTLESGATYRLSYSISDATNLESGDAQALVSPGYAFFFVANGDVSADFTASSTSATVDFRFTGNAESGDTFSVTNISLRKVNRP